ncbi:hypothetical protein F5B22DRAFT_496145 [Xylaria bambusicola]|uniref:uncharacterized protein n=1 Tax=Xylaria bambusicola TaxID=326684 RepID=UPI0020073AE5|nr:uncharacterized protein F5B22DRAFT_496145 [Xylaria bambusicola]KAI0505754.1 hypothetical protein F5B22DRAFT_496145 [Xylaria bambusicola]
MEALAAVALAGNVAQFLEYAIILVTRIPEILNSPNHTFMETNELETIVLDVQQSFCSISISNPKAQDGAASDKTLDGLTKRCLAVSDEIMTITNSLQVNTSGITIIQAIEMVSRTLLKSSKLKQLSERLYDLRGQVSAHLIILIRQQQQEIHVTLRTLTAAGEELRITTENDLQQIIDYLERISKHVDEEQTIGRVKRSRKDKRNKAKVQQTAKHRKLTKRRPEWDHFIDYVRRVEDWAEKKHNSILKSLYFSQLKDREFAIAETHKNTMEWVFKQESANFVEWLREDNSIYWISGKAGSGKSTLMKFLATHPLTIRYLKEWAGQNSLVIAKHFFWSSGTYLQKSQEGLFRALLLQILTQRTDLVQVACANRWNAQYSDSFSPWSHAELVRTLEDAVGASGQTGCKICLFIDGLDEYDGDHAELVTVIRRIGALKSIKICASSRPWLDFSDAFEVNPSKLCLQDLTYGDIRQFIQDNLQQSTRFNNLQQRNRREAGELVLEITKRADGVFLWVFLVVQSILRGLGNEDTILDLQRRLRELPSDLHDYFDRMLSTIEGVYIKRVLRLFLTMSYARTSFPVITFYFLDFGDEPLSAEPLPFLRTWPYVNFDEAEAFGTKKRQLIARCKDLICITPDPDAPVLFAERVGFLHRTVVDFLQTSKIKQKLLGIAGGDFDPVRILLRANLGQARSLMHLHRYTYIKPYLKQWVLGTLYYAHQSETLSGNAEVDVLDELESIITKAFSRWDFSHAVDCVLDIAGITSFLELACKCDLAAYIGHKVPQCTKRELDTLAPKWKDLLEIRRDSDFEVGVRQLLCNEEDDWRVGRLVGCAGSFEEDTPVDVGTHDMSPALPSPPTYRIRGILSKLARVFDRL